MDDGWGGKDRDKWPATKQTARTELEGFSPSRNLICKCVGGEGSATFAMAGPADCGDTPLSCAWMRVRYGIFGVRAWGGGGDSM